jgi:hypothetical protein
MSKVSKAVNDLITEIRNNPTQIPKLKLLIHKAGCDVQVGDGVTALRSGTGDQVAKIIQEGIKV